MRTALWADARDYTDEQLAQHFVLTNPHTRHWTNHRTARELNDHEVVRALNENQQWQHRNPDSKRIPLCVRALLYEVTARRVRLAVRPTHPAAPPARVDDLVAALGRLAETLAGRAEALRLARVHAERQAAKLGEAQAATVEGLNILRQIKEMVR